MAIRTMRDAAAALGPPNSTILSARLQEYRQYIRISGRLKALGLENSKPEDTIEDLMQPIHTPSHRAKVLAIIADISRKELAKCYLNDLAGSLAAGKEVTDEVVAGLESCFEAWKEYIIEVIVVFAELK